MTELMATQGRQSNQDRKREVQFTMLFKVVHGLAAVPPEGHIEKVKTRTTAKNSPKLIVYVPNTEVFRNSFFPKNNQRLERVV